MQYSSGVAANVSTGGSLTFNSSSTRTSLVSNNRFGLVIFANGSLRPLDVVVENNQSIGINIWGGGTLFTEGYASGGLVVQGNAGHGIIVQPLSTANFGGQVSLNNNAEFGLVCTGVHSISGLGNVLATGNGAGDIAGSCGYGL